MRSCICFLFLVFCLSLTNYVNAQDSLQYHKKFYKIQKQSIFTLSGWSILNLGMSPPLSGNFFKPTNSREYFYLTNFNWNLLNAGIAGFGYYSIHRNSHKKWSISELNIRKRKLERALAVNIGLDFLYIASGILLRNASNPKDMNKHQSYLGVGNSFILQGGFLFVYDYVFLKRLKKLKYKR